MSVPALPADPSLPPAEQARQALQEATAAQEAARRADALRLAGGTWIKAEERMTQASQRLEKGDAKGAARAAGEARGLYAEAELVAIKAALLTPAREQVLALGPAGESALDGDRVNTAPAEELARQATLEARRALALSRLLGAAKERGASSEDLALDWEGALARAAAAAGLEALPPGPEAGSAALATGLAAQKARADQQADELRQRDLQVGALEDEIRDLDARLAGASNETRGLTERLEAREHARAQYDQLAASFSPDQAVVLRQGEDIVLRLTGLAFANGTARFSPAAKPVLSRLRDALALYPGATFTVESHTDPGGDSAANQRLSQARAEALRDYLVKQLQLAPGRVTAIGYGDSRPVANNASAEGRRQNRRIDLVIATRDGAH